MLAEEPAIISHIKVVAGDEPIYYVPNKGNAGDSVITWAAISLFKRFGIDYHYCYDWKRFNPTGKVIVYGGGGNLIDGCYSCAEAMGAMHQKSKRFILLPHTIMGHEDLLKDLGDNVDIVCRERRTSDYVNSLNLKANIILTNDLVFDMDVAELKADWKAFVTLFFKSRRYRMRLRKNIGFEIKKLFSKKNAEMSCIRKDGEKTDMTIPADNVDISAVFAYGMKTELDIRCATYRFCQYINAYDKVTTNRLHVAIVATLLGKAVNVYPNSYYKNQAIYEYSMMDKFDNAKWMGD